MSYSMGLGSRVQLEAASLKEKLLQNGLALLLPERARGCGLQGSLHLPLRGCRLGSAARSPLRASGLLVRLRGQEWQMSVLWCH